MHGIEQQPTFSSVVAGAYNYPIGKGTEDVTQTVPLNGESSGIPM